MNPLFIAKLIGYAVAAAFIGYGVHIYNGYIRAPLLKEITLLEDLRKADAQAAQVALDQRKIENEKAIKGYVDYARTSDEKYSADIAAIDRLRDHAAAAKQRSSVTGQTGTGGSSTPDATPANVTATGSRYSGDLEELALYAAEVNLYAQSCYEFVNGK